jgi:hypothetical protein
MKYVITKKCYANEFVMVEAENEQEAFDKAKNGEGSNLGGYLEFGGYQPVETWQVEELTHKEETTNE